jgi:hypothetical protein
MCVKPFLAQKKHAQRARAKAPKIRMPRAMPDSVKCNFPNDPIAIGSALLSRAVKMAGIE